MYRKIIKASFDRLAAIIGLILFSPLFVIILIILAVYNKGDVFFVQHRPGKNGRIFKILKFKTMLDIKDAQGNLLPDKDRLTSVGRIIRKTSLDELPQLLNVLYGEMSLVGPRPLLPEYLPKYSKRQSKRHEVKPGITGWAQVNGRNAIEWDKKLELDVWYVENQSLFLDMKILWMTLRKVFRAEGVSSANSETAEKFRGNE